MVVIQVPKGVAGKQVERYSLVSALWGIFFVFLPLSHSTAQTPAELIGPLKLPPPAIYLTIGTVTPQNPTQNGSIDVLYDVWNMTQWTEQGGHLVGKVLGSALQPGGNVGLSVNLAPGAHFGGHLTLASLPKFGSGTIELSYLGSQHCVPTQHGPDCTQRSHAQESQPVVVSIDRAKLADEDKDGIYDVIEDGLLQRFRPYVYFTADEQYTPADPTTYIRQSEMLRGGEDSSVVLFTNSDLKNDPTKILAGFYQSGSADWCGGPSPEPGGCSSNITAYTDETGYHLHPVKINGNQPAYFGVGWDVENVKRNVGLYGHVAPIRLNSYCPSSCRQRWNNMPSGDAGHLYYKVEYWQFFGFNDSGSANVGKHQGDWTTVQLLIDADEGYFPLSATGIIDYSHFKIIAVSEFAHGIEWRFDLGSVTETPTVSSDGKTKEYKGPNGKLPITMVSKILDGQCDPPAEVGQNNTLRMYQDPQTLEFTHPVAYAEKGAHELWMTNEGDWVGAASHDGAGAHHFLVNTPPNLGEVENPRSDLGDASLVLLYNGFWGIGTSDFGSSPQGPALHDQWTYPPCAANQSSCVATSVQAKRHGY